MGSKTEKQKKKVGKEGCKKGTKVMSESKRCVVIQMVAKWKGHYWRMRWSSATACPSIIWSSLKRTGWRWPCERQLQRILGNTIVLKGTKICSATRPKGTFRQTDPAAPFSATRDWKKHADADERHSCKHM